VVDAGDGADDPPGAGVLGDQVGEGAGPVVAPHDLGVADHHAIAGVDPVDGVHLGLRGDRADEDVADQLGARTVPVEIEPVGVAGVDEQLVRRQPHQDVRVPRVDADVPLAGFLRAQRVDDPVQVGEGLAEDQPAPAHVQDDVGLHALELMVRRLRPRAARERRRGRHRRPASVTGDPG
jgi:hypothetical protein